MKLHPSSSSDDDTDDNGADDDHPTAAAIGGADDAGGGGGEVPLFNGEESAETHEEEAPPLVKRSTLQNNDDEEMEEEEVDDDKMEEEVDDGSEDENESEDDAIESEKEDKDASSSNSSFISHDESLSTGEDASYAPTYPSSNGTDLDSTYTDVAATVDELLEDQKEDERVTRKTPRCQSTGFARYAPSDEEKLLDDDYTEDQHDQVGRDGTRQTTIPELIPRYLVRQSHAHPAPPAAARTQWNAHASDVSQKEDRESRDIVAKNVIRRLIRAQEEREKHKREDEEVDDEVNSWVEGLSRAAVHGRNPDSPLTSNGKAAAVHLTLDDSSDEEESDPGDSSTADSESSGSSGRDSSSTSQDQEDEH